MMAVLPPGSCERKIATQRRWMVPRGRRVSNIQMKRAVGGCGYLKRPHKPSALSSTPSPFWRQDSEFRGVLPEATKDTCRVFIEDKKEFL
ncbi:hypothetical protein AB1N83_005267 [Pleurotus pulmonarius]